MTNVIEIVRNITVSEFKEKYFDTKTPVVIRGLQEDAPIAGAKTMEDAISMFGDQKFEVVEEYVSKFRKDDSFVQEPQTWSLEKYLRTVEADKDTVYCVREFNTPDRILEALKIPDLVKVRDDAEVTSNIFMANESNTAQMHFDGDHRHVFLYQVFGRKRIIMISPEQARKLNPVLNQSWLMLQNYTEEEKQHFVESTGAWDYTLEPGDTVYFPMMMWHHLEYTDTGLSVNFRFGRSKENQFLAEHIHRDMYVGNVAWMTDFDTPPAFFDKPKVLQMIRDELAKFEDSPLNKYKAMRALFRDIYERYCDTALQREYFISSDESIIDSSKALSSLASQPYHFNNWMRFHGQQDALTNVVQDLKKDAMSDTSVD